MENYGGWGGCVASLEKHNVAFLYTYFLGTFERIVHYYWLLFCFYICALIHHFLSFLGTFIVSFVCIITRGFGV